MSSHTARGTRAIRPQQSSLLPHGTTSLSVLLEPRVRIAKFGHRVQAGCRLCTATATGHTIWPAAVPETCVPCVQACLSWWSIVSPFGGFGSTAAIVFVLLVAAIKALWEDGKRHQEDRRTNASIAHILQPDGAYLCTGCRGKVRVLAAVTVHVGMHDFACSAPFSVLGASPEAVLSEQSMCGPWPMPGWRTWRSTACMES